ncbi:MAG: hypothetical protein ABW156_05780 [Jiangellaceae bacterium]
MSDRDAEKQSSPGLHTEWVRVLIATAVAAMTWLIWQEPGTPLLAWVVTYVLIRALVRRR